jgi:uncharacterized damage-inducible protein DinB
MPTPDLLAPLLDSWDRNNRILVNLLRALPAGALAVRALPSSPTIGEQFTHLNFVRLVFLTEDVPELALPLPPREWLDDAEVDRIASSLESSAAAVRRAVEARLLSGEPMNTNYDHPILFLQHMIFHDAYHHGQIKLTLKLAGIILDDEIVGPLTWGVFIDKTHTA